MNRNKKRNNRDSLSAVIKVLICACMIAAVVVAGLAVKMVKDNISVVPFVSDTSDTAQSAGQIIEETTNVSQPSNQVSTTQSETENTTAAEITTDSEVVNESTSETTTRKFVITQTTTVAASSQTTIAGLVDEDDRIVVDPEREPWNLVVVNSGRKIPSDYKPQLKQVCNSGVYMDYRVAPHYDEMYYAAKKDGITLVPYSGYRSYERQERNYNNLTNEYMGRYNISREQAAAKAATVILPPGTSEHNLGIAMDICNTYDSFANQKEYKWLVENAHKYGFILRYEAEKQPITGIVSEPWHWRYVGVEYAEKIKDSGLCLEEYLDSIGVPY